MDRFVVISGCSGGGKSTLLAELGRRGYAVVAEPGRRIIVEESERQGLALPWIDMAAFARRAITMALADREKASAIPGRVFFDRGLIDAAAALEDCTGEAVLAAFCTKHRYYRRVFLTPPWPEIYEEDPHRRHDLTAAQTEYERLIRIYPALGYEISILPKMGVMERAEFVLNELGE